MEKDFLYDLISLDFFRELSQKFDKKIEEQNVFYSSTLHGSSKTIFLTTLVKNHNQIIVLLPKRIDVNELSVELSVLGLDNKIVAIDSIEIESIQEKLTTIKNKEKSIIISTYELLKVKLPAKDAIDKSTTKLEARSLLLIFGILEVNFFIDEVN